MQPPCSARWKDSATVIRPTGSTHNVKDQVGPCLLFCFKQSLVNAPALAKGFESQALPSYSIKARARTHWVQDSDSEALKTVISELDSSEKCYIWMF